MRWRYSCTHLLWQRLHDVTGFSPYYHGADYKAHEPRTPGMNSITCIQMTMQYSAANTEDLGSVHLYLDL